MKRLSLIAILLFSNLPLRADQTPTGKERALGGWMALAVGFGAAVGAGMHYKQVHSYKEQEYLDIQKIPVYGTRPLPDGTTESVVLFYRDETTVTRRRIPVSSNDRHKMYFFTGLAVALIPFGIVEINASGSATYLSKTIKFGGNSE